MLRLGKNPHPSLPLLQHLEKTGELPEALKHYELSGCAHIEVPRMYFETHQIGELEKYVNSKVWGAQGGRGATAKCRDLRRGGGG